MNSGGANPSLEMMRGSAVSGLEIGSPLETQKHESEVVRIAKMMVDLDQLQCGAYIGTSSLGDGDEVVVQRVTAGRIRQMLEPLAGQGVLNALRANHVENPVARELVSHDVAVRIRPRGRRIKHGNQVTRAVHPVGEITNPLLEGKGMEIVGRFTPPRIRNCSFK